MDKPNNINGRTGRPAGIPVSRAIQILPGIANDDLRDAVTAIGRVHSDGVLQLIPMLMRSRIVDAEGRSSDGRYSFGVSSDGQPAARSIQILVTATHRSLVTVHEVGHFLDMHGLPGASFASADAGVEDLDDWRSAMVGSRAIEMIEGHSTTNDPELRERVRRLLSAEEVWARSYAQFIAIRSDHAALRNGLDAMRSRKSDGVYLPRQWDDDDFVEIDAAIESLFRRLGWIV
jgi:hypothetical protein